VFWLEYDDSTLWRSLSFYHRPKVEVIEALADSEFAAIPEAFLPACPKISKPELFIAYLEGFVAVCPHRRVGGTADPRAAGFAEEAAAFVRLNTFKNQERGAHGLREAHAREMGEGPNGISPAARRGDEQEAAPSEQSVVAAAAQAANARRSDCPI
jgi:hypothetical protein